MSGHAGTAAVQRRDGHQHICLAFTDPAEFGARAARFLADGLDRGLRVRLVVGEGGDDLADRVGRLLDPRPGAFEVATLTDAYRDGQVAVDPSQQVRAYAAATDAALTAGFTGLRVAADATSLVGTPTQLDAFARYEHLVDRYMVGHPFSAMCGYRHPDVGADTVAQLACLHPQADPEPAFRLHAGPTGTVLSGEVDLAGRQLLRDALDRAGLPVVSGRIVLDAAALDYVDHRGLLVLSELARARSATVVLRTRLRMAARLVEILDIPGVRVELP